jgi:hypothetical protein
MSKQQVKSFSVRDRVSWRSQAGGHWKQKAGTVVEVVPAHKIPRDKGFGSSRHHESYIVSVLHSPNAKPERYWPLTRNLRLAKRGSTSTTEASPSVPELPMRDYDPKPAPDVLVEDLKTDHLPVQVLEGDKDLLWKDVQDAERAIANAESTN